MVNNSPGIPAEKKDTDLGSLLEGVKKIHFVGIGGSGMSPLAEIMHAWGYSISGSDVNESDNLKRMRSLGIEIAMTQSSDNVAQNEPQLVIYTTAVGEDNPEVVYARQNNIKTLERASLLGLITHRHSNNISVAGTHGKTTTTSMISQIFLETDENPTIFIGGRLPLINANGRAGSDELMICEACEFQNHYHGMKSTTAIILNVDADHLDFFGDLNGVIASFKKFAEQTEENIIINLDDENSMKTVEGLSRQKIITFSRYGKDADFTARNISAVNGAFPTYDLYHKDELLASIKLGVPGEYNISNSLAAAAAAYIYGIAPAKIAKGLLNFKGAGRRFEFLGTFKGITVADDYAHHPTEITATLTAAKKLGYKRVWAVFQPFTFTRTVRHLDEFIMALSLADKAVVSDIMGSREKNLTGISSKDITDKLDNGYYLPTFEEITRFMLKNLQEGDLVVTMGGGDVYKCARMIAEALK